MSNAAIPYPKGPRRNRKVLGPKYHSAYSIWALQTPFVRVLRPLGLCLLQDEQCHLTKHSLKAGIVHAEPRHTFPER